MGHISSGLANGLHIDYDYDATVATGGDGGAAAAVAAATVTTACHILRRCERACKWNLQLNTIWYHDFEVSRLTMSTFCT